MSGSLSIEHTDVSSWISRIVDPEKMGAIEGSAGDNEENQSKEHPNYEAANVSELPALIFLTTEVPGIGSWLALSIYHWCM